MKLAIFIVIFVSIIGTVLTLLVVGKGDAEYDTKSKKNVTNLTAIYAITIILSIIILAVYLAKTIS